MFIFLYTYRKKKEGTITEEGNNAAQTILTLEFKFYSFHSFIYKLKDSDFQVERTLSMGFYFD